MPFTSAAGEREAGAGEAKVSFSLGSFIESHNFQFWDLNTAVPFEMAP